MTLLPSDIRRICIVDDQQIALDAANLLLRDIQNIEVTGLFTSAEKLIDEFDFLQPDITVMDLELPGISGIEAIILLKSKYQKAKFLVLSNHSDNEKLFNALKAGADGYLLKSDSLEYLVPAHNSIYEGGGLMSPEITKKVINYFQKDDGHNKFKTLSEKEKMVLQYLVDGLLYKEIAVKLSVTIDMVKKHTQSIYEKLHVRTRSEAITKYLTSI